MAVTERNDADSSKLRRSVIAGLSAGNLDRFYWLRIIYSSFVPALDHSFEPGPLFRAGKNSARATGNSVSPYIESRRNRADISSSVNFLELNTLETSIESYSTGNHFLSSHRNKRIYFSIYWGIDFSDLLTQRLITTMVNFRQWLYRYIKK